MGKLATSREYKYKGYICSECEGFITAKIVEETKTINTKMSDVEPIEEFICPHCDKKVNDLQCLLISNESIEIKCDFEMNDNGEVKAIPVPVSTRGLRRNPQISNDVNLMIFNGKDKILEGNYVTLPVSFDGRDESEKELEKLSKQFKEKDWI